jgi:VIT1/CCC1 family predicted Fe2+/Mn2+ transporter
MQAKMMDMTAQSADFISAYELAMQEVISGCGSRQAANKMIGELQRSYEGTSAELKKAIGNPAKQDAILRAAKMETNKIIEKYAPNTSSHFHELVISYSFGAIMLTIPLIAAASLLTAATGIIAAGSTYFISAKILGNWKAMVAKRRVSEFSGVVGPKHIKGLPKIMGAARKK